MAHRQAANGLTLALLHECVVFLDLRGKAKRVFPNELLGEIGV